MRRGASPGLPPCPGLQPPPPSPGVRWAQGQVGTGPRLPSCHRGLPSCPRFCFLPVHQPSKQPELPEHGEPDGPKPNAKVKSLTFPQNQLFSSLRGFTPPPQKPPPPNPFLSPTHSHSWPRTSRCTSELPLHNPPSGLASPVLGTWPSSPIRSLYNFQNDLPELCSRENLL